MGEAQRTHRTPPSMGTLSLCPSYKINKTHYFHLVFWRNRRHRYSHAAISLASNHVRAGRHGERDL